jgi:error-prone DNA polymerase
MPRMSDFEAPLFEQPEFAQHAEAHALADPHAPANPLPVIAGASHVTADYITIGLSLKSHPLRFMREALAAKRVIENATLHDPSKTPTGTLVTVAGMVLVRQRADTARYRG